jgi:hypothetical protein
MVQYQYDTSGRMCKVTDWVGDTFAYSYDADSENTSMQASSSTANVTVTDSYDGGGRLDETGAATGSTNLYAETYTLDADGKPLTDTPSSAASGFTSTLDVSDTPTDVNDQPTGYGLSGSPIAIQYDAAGPVNEDARVFQTSNLTQDGQLCWTDTSSGSGSCSSAPDSSAATSYEYDPDGNLASETPGNSPTVSAANGWNAAAELACENTNGSSCSLSSPTSSTTTFSYDGDRNLASWTTGTSGSYVSQTITWSGAMSAHLLSSYATPSDETTDYVYGIAGTPVEQITLTGSSTVTNLLLNDGRGSVVGMIRLSGSAANSLENLTSYGPYGEPESEQEVSGSPTPAFGLSKPNTQINSDFGSATDSTDTTLLGYNMYVAAPGVLILSGGRIYDPQSASLLSMDNLAVQRRSSLTAQVGPTVVCCGGGGDDEVDLTVSAFEIELEGGEAQEELNAIVSSPVLLIKAIVEATQYSDAVVNNTAFNECGDVYICSAESSGNVVPGALGVYAIFSLTLAKGAAWKRSQLPAEHCVGVSRETAICHLSAGLVPKGV